MPDSNSIYSLNKRDASAIVYTNANGKTIRLTSADFGSEEEFRRWKEWSDEDFHTEEKQDHIYEDNNSSLEAQPEHIAQAPSIEAELEHRSRNRAREKYNSDAILSIRAHLTEKQFRRVWLYYVRGLSEKQIARIENVRQQSISDSIRRTVNKLKTFPMQGEKAL